jgi:hypothetical protein
MTLETYKAWLYGRESKLYDEEDRPRAERA